MVFPELLIIVAADKALAGLLIDHFSCRAYKLGSYIEKIERK
jgi:hypothetical protein